MRRPETGVAHIRIDLALHKIRALEKPAKVSPEIINDHRRRRDLTIEHARHAVFRAELPANLKPGSACRPKAYDVIKSVPEHPNPQSV
jgi:hypothetical protein